MLRRTLVGLATAASVCLLAAGLAQAADYPAKPVALIAPYGPGGASDLAARTLASSVPAYLGNAMIVTNRTGAAGVTGSTFVAKSKPNGYTLLLARVGSQVGVPAINTKIPYRWNDFTFLGLLELNPFVLVVNPDGPYTTFADLENAVKAGHKISYSSAGVGTLLHIAVAVFADALGADFKRLKHIPYKGGGKAAAAVIGGHTDMSFQNLSAVIGAINSGQLRALAVTTKERFKAIKDVPTVGELGHPKLEAIVGWSGLYGPKGLPQSVIDKWVDVLQSVKKDKSWNRLTIKLGSIPAISSPTAMESFAEAQFNTFRDITSRLGMTIK
ncbi:MAG: tripartite tricarboxylate transporter substrate binding protein [Gammaproteobacteria bacterium]|nr:tripartite tricarboxylate transporter substrate binding protein [Gammaproteobacteria bacterium]